MNAYPTPAGHSAFLKEQDLIRSLHEYSMRDWLRLAPLLHAGKQGRNVAMRNAFCRLRPRRLQQFLAGHQHLKGQRLAVIVAFEQPWALDWLLRMAAQHVGGTTFLVFDNSRSASARAQIRRVCDTREVSCLDLPPNPVRHPCRSHGLAMTWIFRNVLRSLRPAQFGFIDHDLIPLGRVQAGAPPINQPCYGLPCVSEWGWHLWAGYCFFDFPAVEHLPLDFNTDLPRRLDTGGRNWHCLYRRYDVSALRLANTRFAQMVDPVDGSHQTVQLIDDNWLHLAGASYSAAFRNALGFYERVERATDDGAKLDDLLVPNSGDGPNPCARHVA